MAVAAAKQDWLPRIFAELGHVGFKGEARNEQAAAETPNTSNPNTDGKTTSSDAPINAIALSAALATLYILLGSFRALVTFNGLGEYSFFFLAVLGAVVLRWREPGLERPYRPSLLVPLVFAVVSGFVVVRGAIFAPVLAGVLIVLWGIGGLVYWGRRQYRRVEG